MKMTETESLQNTVYTLLDKFDRYGHLYDTDGYVKDRYIGIYEDLRDGRLFDNKGYPIMDDPFVNYNLNCNMLEDETQEAVYESANDEDFAYPYRYLNLHNGNSNEFRGLLVRDVKALTVQDIVEEYLDSMVRGQLINMLRRGKNYASKEPVSGMFGDDYLTEVIALTWKSILIGTLTARDLANEITFLYFHYNKGKVRYEEPEPETGFHCSVVVSMPYAGDYQRKRLDRIEKQKEAEKTQEKTMHYIAMGGREKTVQEYNRTIDLIRKAINEA